MIAGNESLSEDDRAELLHDTARHCPWCGEPMADTDEEVCSPECARQEQESDAEREMWREVDERARARRRDEEARARREDFPQENA